MGSSQGKTSIEEKMFALPEYSSPHSDTKQNKEANYCRYILIPFRPNSFCFATWEP